jgi:hypothetical protein
MQFVTYTKEKTMTIFMIQYAHKGNAYEGWFNIRGYRTLEMAEKALEAEKALAPDFKYCINTYQFVTE